METRQRTGAMSKRNHRLADCSDEEETEVVYATDAKLHKCTRCGYVSERKSNVGRHFRRIHCPLKKPKRCVCERRFSTKGEYYIHCKESHPSLCTSSYIVGEKYKIGLKKAKLQAYDSTDQRSEDKENSLNDKNNNINNDTEASISKQNRIIISIDNSDSLFELENNAVYQSSLPFKKRFLKPKSLSDITNCASKKKDDTYMLRAQIDAMHRAFISQIDFDELNTIMILRDLKDNH